MGETHMKNILRNAAVALTVLSLSFGFAVARPVSGQLGSGNNSVNACPIPTCPMSDPNGCGIYR